MLDDARLSLRDLAYLTAAVSDNTAADTLWDQIGLETVNRTVAVHTLRDLIAAIAEDTGPDSPVDPAVVARLRVLDPSFTNHSTPREVFQVFTRRKEAPSLPSRTRRPSWLMSSTTPPRPRSRRPGQAPGRAGQAVLGRVGLRCLPDPAALGQRERPRAPAFVLGVEHRPPGHQTRSWGRPLIRMAEQAQTAQRLLRGRTIGG